MIILLTLFTFILDITFNLYINIKLLYPMFTISFLIILYFLIKNKNNYLLYSIVLGFIYDLIYSNIFINTILFLIISRYCTVRGKTKENFNIILMLK